MRFNRTNNYNNNQINDSRFWCGVQLDLLCVVLFSRSICVFSLSISFIHKYISFFSLLHDHGVSDTSARKCSFALRRLIGYFKAKWKRMKKIYIYSLYVQEQFKSSAQSSNIRSTIQSKTYAVYFFYFKSTVYLMVYFFCTIHFRFLIVAGIFPFENAIFFRFGTCDIVNLLD